MSSRLTEHLSLLASAPDGIKKLRGLILELAVRGKLVPQDPKDEPASELLKRIAAEKARLLAEGAIRGKSTISTIKRGDAPFVIPSKWIWVPFGEIMISRDGERIPVSKDERNGRAKIYDYYGASGVIDKIDGYLFDKPLLLIGEDGANLINRSTPIAFIARGKYWVNNHAHVLDGICEDFLRFIELHINAIDLKPYVTGTAQPKMNQAKMNSIPIALPSLVEQHRIVAKADELMALCDRMEAEQADAEAAHTALVQTLLDTLTLSRDAAELATNWQRLSQHFDTLFTTEASLDALKETILQLAVMGKLVPQDPNDESASELLKRIAAEKVRLVAEGKIRKDKPLAAVAEDEKPFQLPLSWEWVRFANFALDVATGPFGTMIHQSDYVDGGVPLINPSHMLNGRIVANNSVTVTEEMAKELDSYRVFAGDIVMARRGEVGRTALVTPLENRWLCGTGSFVLRFNTEISRDFVVTLFRCTSVRLHLGDAAVGTTMVNLNHSILKNMPVAIPPASEQHRIVAKVDELMALCDSLKADLAESRTRQARLATTLIESALQAA